MKPDEPEFFGTVAAPPPGSGRSESEMGETRVEPSLGTPVGSAPPSLATGLEDDEEPRADPRARLEDAAGPSDLLDTRRKLARWRAFAAGATAVAAGLAAIVLIGLLPDAADRDTGRFLAAMSRDAATPALLVDVNIAEGLVTVRQVGTERPAEGDLELWAVQEGGQPASLGILDPASPVTRIRPNRAGVIPTRGRFDVTAEPQGGSPSGSPTGPVLYSGRLIPTD
jgi:anti-sigma-K factor RskA